MAVGEMEITEEQYCGPFMTGLTSSQLMLENLTSFMLLIKTLHVMH
jgi:hypothetical protein